MAKEYRFNFKSLDVYQAAVEHFAWSVRMVSELERAPFKVISQFLTAPLSVVANVGEANGREKKPGESAQHYRYALGSAYESAAFLDAYTALGVLDDDEYNDREEELARIASMLFRLMEKQERRAANYALPTTN